MKLKVYCLITIFILMSIYFCVNVLADASISGVVTFEGKAPRVKIIRMDADPMCLVNKKDIVYSQAFVLGEGNTLGNVFVYIKDSNNKKKYLPPVEAAVMDQKGCDYFPRVLPVMVGQKVKFLNPDNTLHNVHAMCKVNREFNDAMPNVRTEMEKTFDKPEGMFAIRCDVHPWMSAWMAVMEHPFFTVTKKDGQFEIKDIPPGTYELEAWHEKLGTQTAKVTIKDGESEKIVFTFSSPN